MTCTTLMDCELGQPLKSSGGREVDAVAVGGIGMGA